jgi:hypothetical protein
MNFPRIGYVTASVLHLRQDPSTQNAPKGRLTQGTELNLLRQSGGWYQVEAGRETGFVYGDFVALSDPQPAAGFLKTVPELIATPLEPLAGRRLDPLARRGDWKPMAEAWNRQGGLIEPICARVSCATADALAVLVTESGGLGFGSGGRLIIRFENHVFWDEWGKRNPATFHKHFRFSAQKRWTGHQFRASMGENWQGIHGSQFQEWRVLEFARKLNDAAALRSISMGAPQVMGFNHARIGYDSVAGMFAALQSGLRHHVFALFDFIKGPGTGSRLLEALQRGKYADFAALYNGPGEAARYGELIRSRAEALADIL